MVDDVSLVMVTVLLVVEVSVAVIEVVDVNVAVKVDTDVVVDEIVLAVMVDAVVVVDVAVAGFQTESCSCPFLLRLAKMSLVSSAQQRAAYFVVGTESNSKIESESNKSPEPLSPENISKRES